MSSQFWENIDTTQYNTVVPQQDKQETTTSPRSDITHLGIYCGKEKQEKRRLLQTLDSKRPLVRKLEKIKVGQVDEKAPTLETIEDEDCKEFVQEGEENGGEMGCWW